MAARSVKYNELEEKVSIIQGDIKEADRIFPAASFDVVTTNPPYMNENHGLKNPESHKAIARHEILCTLEDVVREGAKVLKPGGHFYMVHRPHRLVEIFELMRKYGMEPKRMRLVHPFSDKPANMVLVEGVRGGKPQLTVEEPLIIYREQGIYSKEVVDLYEK